MKRFLPDEAIELVVVNTVLTPCILNGAKSLTAGKHVLLGKPFTPTDQEANALINWPNSNYDRFVIICWQHLERRNRARSGILYNI